MTYFQILKKQQIIPLRKLIPLSSIIICLCWFSSCMQAEKISLDTSGANGLIAGALGIEGGFFGANQSAQTSTDINVNTSGFTYNAGLNSQPIQLNFSGDKSGTCAITNNGLHTCSGIFELGDDYNVTINSHAYTGGQRCNITNGNNGTVNGSQPTVEVECTRSALAFVSDDSNKLSLLSIDRTGSNPIESYGSINNVSKGSPSLLWNGSQYLLMYGSSSNHILVGRRYIDGTAIGAALSFSAGAPVTSSAISYDQTNEQYLIVWIQNNSGNYVVKGQFLSTAGTTVGSIVNIETTTGFTREDTAIIKTATHFIIAYSQKDVPAGVSSIQVKSIPLSGGVVSSGFYYDCDENYSEDKVCHHPSLIANDTGALLSWSTSYSDGEITSNIYQTKLDSSGSQIQSFSLVAKQPTAFCSPDEVDWQSAKPFLAYNGSTYLLTWEYTCANVGASFSWVNAIRTNGSSAIGSLINITPNNSDEYYGGPTNWNGKLFEVFYIQIEPTIEVILSLRDTDGSELQKLQKSGSTLGLDSVTPEHRIGLQ